MAFGANLLLAKIINGPPGNTERDYFDDDDNEDNNKDNDNDNDNDDDDDNNNNDNEGPPS